MLQLECLSPYIDTERTNRLGELVTPKFLDSAESGLGLLAQLDIARNHAEQLMAANPALELKDVFTDTAVSATTYKLRNRDAGRKLNAELRDGDHIIYSTLDRGLRPLPIEKSGGSSFFETKWKAWHPNHHE